jgi:2-oxoisovalerate dehydrogenase E1 component
MDRTGLVENQYLQALKSLSRGAHQSSLDPSVLSQLTRLQIQSRLLDYEARRLKAKGYGFYTIGSAGHEGNVVLGHLLGRTDPCLLHYRSGALMLARAQALGHASMVSETVRSFCADKNDPCSGGRHKVWGHPDLWVIPQTSTIASHLPKAVGMSFGISRAAHMKMDMPVAADSIVMCNFGDASCNHASAQTAFNAASWSAYQKLPTPMLFVCEDNGFGISVRTPRGWIASKMKARPDIAYFFADGLDLDHVFTQSMKAIAYVREKRKPAFLHMRTIRLFGHAGSDVESAYRLPEEIEIEEKLDPIIRSSQLCVNAGSETAQTLLDFYLSEKARIQAMGDQAAGIQHLTTVEEVIAPLYRRDAAIEKLPSVKKKTRTAHFDQHIGHLPEQSPKPRHMAMLLNWALHDLMLAEPKTVLFGEDVARKGGVYHVTHGLVAAYGTKRVFNTLLDETTILGLAIGMAQIGFIPMPEIQYLAYYHNAQDQIRGEAASQAFFSNAKYVNPMVIRMAAFAYQKGFGGHFHNDHSVAAILDVPGVLVMVPSRGDDAVSMLHSAVAFAKAQGRVVFFLEPIALYMQKDLHQAGDGQWLQSYPAQPDLIETPTVRIYHPDHKDMVIFSYANGLHMSLQAAQTLEQKHGLRVKVVDLRFLKPLPWQDMHKEADGYQKVLIVDECRQGGGVAEAIVSGFHVAGFMGQMRVVQAVDTYIPLGTAANVVLPQVSDVVKAAIDLASA